MVAKIPPPPPIASNDPEFNRWLIELTSIFNSDGGINPSEVDGLPTVITQVGTNTTNIGTLTATQGAQGGQIAAINGEVTTINGEIATINGDITTIGSEIAALEGRPQLYNGAAAPLSTFGNDNDWYAQTAGTKHIYVKLAGAWVIIV